MSRHRLSGACSLAILLSTSALGTLWMAGPADAADATWLGGTAAGDYNTAANWNPTGPPSDTAVFGASADTNVTLATNLTLGGWTFNAGAIAYHFAGAGRSVFLTGAGTLTDGNAVTITSDANLNFRNTSTAGDSTVTMVAAGSVAFLNSSSAGSANLTFNILGSFTGTSTAGSAVITNNSPSTLSFVGTSTAGSAAISNSGTVRFGSNGTAANAVITNRAGGVVSFAANSNGGNAAFVNVDTATVDFSQSLFNTRRLTVGSLAGGGAFLLGQNELTVGGNNQSTTVTGTIADGGLGGGTGGSLVKAGTGTMTLSGANTYSGGTAITAGTLSTGTVTAGVFSSLGTGLVTLAGGTLRTTATGVLTNDVVFATGTTSVLAAATGTTMLIGGPTSAFSLGAGATAVFGSTADTGTIRFSGRDPFAGPLPSIHPGSVIVVAGGTLQVHQDNLFRMLGFTGSVTVDAGATIDMSGSILEIINNLGGAGTVVTGGPALTPLLLTSFPNRSNVFAGTISGDRAVQTDGNYTFSGTNTYTGGTIICSCSTLLLGSGGTTGSILGNVQNDGTLVFNRSDSYGFAGIISGSGAVSQIGSGTTTLSALNTYGGLTAVSAGTLAIAAGGGVTGGVLNNATLNSAGSIGGGLTNTGTVSVTGGAIDGGVVNSAGSITVGGPVTSNGGFTNAGGATLQLDAQANYVLAGLLSNAGNVTVQPGGLLAADGGIVNLAGGAILNNGSIRDDLDNAGSVTNNGIYLATVATNSGAGSIVNAVTGSWTGDVVTNAASIANSGVWTGNVLSNTGTLINSGTWTGTVANAGTFVNDAGASLSGLLTNSAGTTINNGVLAGGALVSGGTLTGAGSVAGLTVGAGSRFAPGSGLPGSSTRVAGNLVLEAGSRYAVQIDSNAASFASVSGTATLGGATVQAFFASGAYVERQYTIVNAAGGVIGSFGSQVNTNLPANFKSSLSTDATNAYLNLALDYTPTPTPAPTPAPAPAPAPPPNSGLNINRTNVANALTGFFNRTGGIPLAFGALSPAGLTMVSGEHAVAAQQSTFDAMTQFINLIGDPFTAGRGDGFNPTATPSAFAADVDAQAYAASSRKRSPEREAYAVIAKAAPVAAPAALHRWSVWTAGFGGTQTTDGNAGLGSNTTTSRIAAGAVGADYRVSPGTLAGFAMAGAGTSFHVSGLGGGRSDLFQAGGYVRHHVGSAYISAAAAYGWQDVTTERSLLGGGPTQLRAQFNVNSWSGRVEAGSRYALRFAGPSAGITPYAAGQFTAYDAPAYAERSLAGASLFALNYQSASVTAWRSELGLRADASWAVNDALFTLRGRAAWAHNFDTDRSLVATFQSLPGASFVVHGAAPARDAALTTAAAEIKFSTGIAIAAIFEGEFSEVTRSYAGKGVVKYAW